jgi:hypothetical protein
VAARRAYQLGLGVGACGAGLGEAGGDHDEAVHLRGGAVGDDVADPVGRHRDHRQVDRLIHFGQ